MAMKPEWAHAKNILAVRLDSMGDVLMTSPALAAVRHSAPDMRLTLLTSGAGAEVASMIDAVDETLVYAAPWVGPASAAGSARSDLNLMAELAARRFDAAIIFTVCTQSALPAALLCRLAGIPLRLAHSRENPYALLTNWAPEQDTCIATARHEVQRQLDLVHHVGYETADEHLRLRYDGNDVQQMQQALAAAGGSPDRPYIVIHPGASAASRRYPADRYGVVAQALQAHGDYQVVFTGSDEEAELVAQAASRMERPPINLAGRLSLGGLAALIAGARALLCNNTGPAHLAAALGTPVAVLYALTNPQHTPWRVPSRVLSHDVPCRNCLKSKCPQIHHDCLERIAPETVLDAVHALLAETESSVQKRAVPQAWTRTSHWRKPSLAPCARPLAF
ncbi:lipopolysaccharide heptosyltransferase II [Comamonas terrae]|uniref:lipopolysaccharide heptosyltransferase II n=2 Tax=Comamonas terrae TaxID=673548 RepID=A0ABW5UR25_9BURK